MTTNNTQTGQALESTGEKMSAITGLDVKAYKVAIVEIATVEFSDKNGKPVEVTTFATSKKEAEQLAEKWAEQNDGEFKVWTIKGEPRYVARVSN